MRVLSVCEYLMDGDRRPDHFTPYQIVQAVKGKDFNGYALLDVEGRRQRLDSSNPEVAVSWVVERLGEQIFDEFEGDRVMIVPIPGHAHTSVQLVEGGRVHHLGLALAEALRRREMTASAFPLLHWDTAMQSAREGGPRDATVLQPHLRIVAANNFAKIVLLDDVVTTGGHIAAAHGVLANAGWDVADVAFVVARTVYDKDEALGTRVEECPRSMPDTTLDLLDLFDLS